MNNKDLPAFPLQIERVGFVNGYDGLTKREYFAAKMIDVSDEFCKDMSQRYVLELLDKPSVIYDAKKHYPQILAKMAVEFADALLNELKKSENEME